MHTGQEQGQFRDFDINVMCATIRGTLNAALAHIASGGPVEPYASELRAVFGAATTTAKGDL
ncbi:hypothetical protein LKL35_07285 [Streptomyces sp. ET3-23]|uniref:hypothetical protein n=1 Tax=Streptomyces sp. ET3-23 TaxID=2885643 RepID=UPI001D12CC0A|nr:hypothetical protein [Streptomyces sp. ET3-23]MCC2275227.1 hypothetical protein [Streptomyces sp. ET3-23]